MVSTCKDETISSKVFGETMSIADVGVGTGVDLSSEVLSMRDDNVGGDALVTKDTGNRSSSEGDSAQFSGR